MITEAGLCIELSLFHLVVVLASPLILLVLHLYFSLQVK